jgi:hypothetical protein
MITIMNNKIKHKITIITIIKIIRIMKKINCRTKTNYLLKMTIINNQIMNKIYIKVQKNNKKKQYPL